ncbi:MAG: hypothetical protein ACHQPI_07870 [Thermoanaerobaculia bacterium]
MTDAPMHVSRIRAEGGRTHRVTAEVDGSALWFESDDAALAPAADAYASALLVASLDRSVSLTMEDDVSPVWLSNVSRLLPVVSRWWGYPQSPLTLRPGPGATPARAGLTALCFSGGVDSFFTLLRSGRRIDRLVFVLGFDVPIGDSARFRAIEASLQEVARETGTRPIVLRTNLREHPAFAPASWERVHGGPLAAVGHLLRDEAGTLLISSSYPAAAGETPWGSHWSIDHLWSSESVEVVHVGAEHHRNEKLRSIANEPLVRKHLRVCWENLSPTGNCSRCDKCVRARLNLEDWGALEGFTAFRDSSSLVDDIDALPPVRKSLSAYRRLAAHPHLSWRLRRALRRLIARSTR